MKTLTLTQPWATLVALGAKEWETRSWSTTYRGLLAIHAAKGFPKWAREECFYSPFSAVLEQHDIHVAKLPLGMVIATCELVDVVRITAANAPDEPERSFGDYTPGRFKWHLTNIQPLTIPIPAKGALSLWDCNLL